MKRSSGYYRGNDVNPYLVCPPDEYPYGPLQRLATRFLNRRIWGENPLPNPILCYLFGRSRGRWIDSLYASAFWLLLIGVEMVACALELFHVSGGLFYLGPLVVMEFLFLPLFAGLWSQYHVVRNYRRIGNKSLFDQISMTPLRPIEFINAFALGAVLTNQGWVIVETCLLSVGAIAVVINKLMTRGFYGRLDLLIFLGLVFIRSLYLRFSVEQSAILAIRALLFIPTPMKASARMVRDWVWPWGVYTILLVLTGMGAGLLLGVATGGLPAIIITLMIVVVILLTLIGPSLQSDISVDAMFWFQRSASEWHLHTGEESPDVPRHIWQNWSLARRVPGRGQL